MIGRVGLRGVGDVAEALRESSELDVDRRPFRNRYEPVPMA
jgi:hypothetical protein